MCAAPAPSRLLLRHFVPGEGSASRHRPPSATKWLSPTTTQQTDDYHCIPALFRRCKPDTSGFFLCLHRWWPTLAEFPFCDIKTRCLSPESKRSNKQYMGTTKPAILGSNSGICFTLPPMIDACPYCFYCTALLTLACCPFLDIPRRRQCLRLLSPPRNDDGDSTVGERGAAVVLPVRWYLKEVLKLSALFGRWGFRHGFVLTAAPGPTCSRSAYLS